MYYGIENNNTLMRDSNSKGIVSVDNEALVAYKRQRSVNRAHKDEMLMLQQDLNNVKNDITEIKQMLKSILYK